MAAFFVCACEQPLSGAGSRLSAYGSMPVQSAGPRLECGYRDAALAVVARDDVGLAGALPGRARGPP